MALLQNSLFGYLVSFSQNLRQVLSWGVYSLVLLRSPFFLFPVLFLYCPVCIFFFFFQVAPYLGLCSGRSSTALVLAQRAQTSLVPPGFTTMARQGLWNSSYFQKSPVRLATLGFSSPSNEPCALLWCHRSEA